MKEEFAREQFSEEEAKKEIQEGLDYLSAPIKSKEGKHPELVDDFDNFEAKKPLERKDLEREIKSFIENNISKLLPLWINCSVDHFNYGGNDESKFIEALNITNEDVKFLGKNYFIKESRDQRGGSSIKFEINKKDEQDPDGYKVYGELSIDDFFALAFMKESIRVDSMRGPGTANRDFDRYYLKNEKRYLCDNDFGVKVYDEAEQKMINGDAANISQFVKIVKSQMRIYRENIEILKQREAIAVDIKHMNDTEFESLKSKRDNGVISNQQFLEEWGLITSRKEQEVFDNTYKTIAENSKNREVIFGGISSRKIGNQIHFNHQRIAEKFGFMSDDPVKDYEQFEKKSHKLEGVLRAPTKVESAGATIEFLWSDFYDKPVIIDASHRQKLVTEAKYGVREFLVSRVIETETDEFRDCYKIHSCGRGEQSPYNYSNADLYDFIKEIGVEKAQQVLAQDDRDISRQMVGLYHLREMNYNFAGTEVDKLKKDLHEAYKLSEAGIWEYLNKREEEQSMEKRSERYKQKRQRELFFEGKRMYWLAQQVWRGSPETNPEDRFYKSHNYIDWATYDLSQFDVDEQNLQKYLSKDINLISSLMNLNRVEIESSGVGFSKGEKSVTLGLIIKALEKGQDLRGVALAEDKKRYLQGVLDGENKDDLEFAISDWKQEWKEAVSKEEIELYYEYASDYILLNPRGLIKYAEWRNSEDGKTWNEVFEKKPEKKSDLDFRICMSCQTQEVRNWYKEAAEYVGSEMMQSYLLRFNATRESGNRQMANWHDNLFWVPNIKRLESADARSVISSIETMDENREFMEFLPRYDKEKDKLKDQGKIQSLRELKKRVFAIESNIDLSELPPQVIGIISAPGFNLSQLEQIRKRPDFKDLVDGKLDEKQPFKAHNRLFAGRSLTDALKEGLGSQKEKIRGTATDPRGLFHSLNQLVKDRVIKDRKMKAADLLVSVPIDLEEEIIKMLQEQKVDIGPTVEAQIHNKSDPEGWVCGNYTDCCMPFGDYKNTDYMFNPVTQYFTIKYNGRIVAQSVVVDSRDSRDNTDVIILDNIEVASNYKNLTPLLSNVYKTFWTEYTSLPVKVGTGYSDLIPPGGKLEQNQYRPKRHIAYSDATGSQIYDLPKVRGVESIDKVVTFSNLTERDAELIAKMEAEAYPEGMVQGKAHIIDILKKQRELEVPGAASSFVVRQGQEPAGYLLVLPEEIENGSGEKVAHIYDMAVLPKFRGTPIIKRIMERVVDIASSYDVAIEAEARASTSYAFLMNRRIQKWLEGKGYKLTRNEKLEKYLGDEDFYAIRLEKKQPPTD